MAWERRKNHVYYYRVRRVGGRVVKEYLGRGPEAEAAAAEDAIRRRERAIRRQAGVEDRHKVDGAVAVIRDLDREVDSLLRAALSCAGYHQHHRGEWRRRRERDQE